MNFEGSEKWSESQKARIRERYKGVNLEKLDVIPAIPQENFYDNTNEKRVAVYARLRCITAKILSGASVDIVTSPALIDQKDAFSDILELIEKLKIFV